MGNVGILPTTSERNYIFPSHANSSRKITSLTSYMKEKDSLVAIVAFDFDSSELSNSKIEIPYFHYVLVWKYAINDDETFE